MKGLFIYYKEINKTNLMGIEKKVLSQIEIFNKNNLNCELKVIPKAGNKISRIFYRIPFFNIYHKWIYDQSFDGYDYIYLRRPTVVTGYFIKFLKRIRKNNSKTKIIMEIPTYPYDWELKSKARNYPLYLRDKFNRRKLSTVLDRISIMNNIDNVFGVDTLMFSNSIDVNSITERKINHFSNKNIRLLSVAMYSNWHGLERIIYGMNEYYKINRNNKVYLNIVGEGYEISKYKELVKRFKLENVISFSGVLTGSKLDHAYDNSDIGLDVFGMFKKNNNISSSLKSREYLAKGIPIVSGCQIDIVDTEIFEYVLIFDNDNSYIDIQKIVEFYNRLYPNQESAYMVSKKLRSFAFKKCDISNGYNKIIEYIKGEIHNE